MDCLSILHLETPPDVPRWAHPHGGSLLGCRSSCLLEQTAVLLSHQGSVWLMPPLPCRNSHHGSCLTIAFPGRLRLRSVLGTTPRKAAAQDVIDPVTCCTHNGTSSTNWTHKGRAMENFSPSSRLGQQLPNLYKKETCISL